MRSVTELPFNQLLGLQQGAGQSGHELRLPAWVQYTNHLGTVHAGALMALAEAASGEFLLRHLGDGSQWLPVVRRMEVKFRRAATGEIAALSSVEPAILAAFDQDLSGRGRALLTITVELHDAQQSHVLSAAVEWFIQKLVVAPETA